MGFLSQEKAFVKSVNETCLRESNHEKCLFLILVDVFFIDKLIQ